MDLIAVGAACLGLVWGWAMTPRVALTHAGVAFKFAETLALSLLTYLISGFASSIIALAAMLLAVATHGLWLKSLREVRMK
jgi:hypothetical protein